VYAKLGQSVVNMPGGEIVPPRSAA